MSKIPIPEPRWFASFHGTALYGVYSDQTSADKDVLIHPGCTHTGGLYTLEELEAYAALRVKEALEDDN